MPRAVLPAPLDRALTVAAELAAIFADSECAPQLRRMATLP